MTKLCNILAIGDVFGSPGRNLIKKVIPEIKNDINLDLVVANGENCAGGIGITQKTAEELFSSGIDVITSGNHIWSHKKDIEILLKENRFVLRPDNFPSGNPGKGVLTIKKDGISYGIINLMGRLYMEFGLDCPFRRFDEVFNENKDSWDIIIVDFHAEATSEKMAFGHYVNKRANIVFGTHTHIPTDDLSLLSSKTAYITDIGMTGPYDSVIGLEKMSSINRFVFSRKNKMKVASEKVYFYGILFTFNLAKGEISDIRKIHKREN